VLALTFSLRGLTSIILAQQAYLVLLIYTMRVRNTLSIQVTGK
jgi:hypothetical protein